MHNYASCMIICGMYNYATSAILIFSAAQLTRISRFLTIGCREATNRVHDAVVGDHTVATGKFNRQIFFRL